MQIEFNSKGQKCFRCLKRNKLILAKPEEEVRQIILEYLINTVHVPKDMLAVEERLARYSIDTADRADIIVDYRRNDKIYPLILIECKNKNVLLSAKVKKQLKRYSDPLGARVLGMTNSIETDWFVWSKEAAAYKRIIELPTYENIIKNQGFEYVPDQPFCPANEAAEEYQDIDEAVRPFAVNLYNLFSNEDDKIPLLKDNGFTIEEDNGLKLAANGNAGGGIWEDYFRQIKVNYGQSYNHIVGICPLSRVFDDKPYLVVEADDGTTSHNSLQLHFYDHIRVIGHFVEVWHDGKITVGKLGPRSPNEMVNLVKEMYPEIVVENKIFLGRLDNSQAFSFQNEDIKLFLSNLIKYTICREKFRAYKKGHIETL
jgi:hypothetical protein